MPARRRTHPRRRFPSDEDARLPAFPPDPLAVLLVALGLALLVIELFVPTFGMLGVAGGAALALACVLLFDLAPGFQPSPPLLIAASAAFAVLALVVNTAAWRAHRRPVVTGEDALVGAIGVVLSWDRGEGWIRLSGERWRASHAAALAPGQQVRVTGRRDLVLLVAPDGPDGR